MWVVTGPFDGVQGQLDNLKSKLLKTGKTYSLGRKDSALVVNHKVISKTHGEFKVGAFTADDVLDPSVIPTLEFFNERKDKAMKITRGEETLTVNPSATMELLDGDILFIANIIPVSISWHRVCCFSSPIRKPTTIQACASLGISISYNSGAEVTHHLTTNYAVTPNVATSLISLTQFVKPEWLDEIIRLGDLTTSDSSNVTFLEQAFTLPNLTKFRPALPASLPHTLKKIKPWEPNEERVNMFRGLKFVFVGEKGREVEAGLRDLVLRGDGECEVFNVHNGRALWRQSLEKWKAKGKKGKVAKKGLVIVADQKSIRVAVGAEQWEEFVGESQSFGLRFITQEKVLHCVVHVDLSYVDCSADIRDDEADQESSSLPDFVANTHPEEPSLTPPNITPVTAPSKKLVKRATSRPPPPQPEKSEDEAIQMAPPRKTLTRRAKGAKPLLIGIDDPSGVDIDPDVPSQKVSSPSVLASSYNFDAPIPARSSRLKRRAGTAFSASDSQPFPPVPEALESSGPPLKKFKELFDASDPDKVVSEGYQTFSSGTRNLGWTSDRQTQLQSATENESTQTQSRPGSRLGVVAEEEESLGQSETRTGGESRGAKRKAEGLDARDIEASQAKKQAVENINAVQHTTARSSHPLPTTVKPQPVKVHKTGAAPGKPDTDAAFLKALASTKKGKKTEDQFDLQFNQLKISKPDLENEEREKEWAVLETFGDEKNVRGNFMVVVEMDVFTRVGGNSRHGEVVAEWQSRPNFKKFKKKVVPGRRSTVELVPSEENDYGMGSAYWKTSNTQPRTQSQSQNDAFVVPPSPKQTRLPLKSQPPTLVRKGKGRALVMESDEEEVVERVVPQKGSRAGPSQHGPPAQIQNKTTRSSRAREKSQPLFLQSDEDEGQVQSSSNDHLDALGQDSEEALTLQSSTGTEAQAAPRKSTRKPASRAKKAPAVTVVDDDSDDGATFKGFRGKRTRPRS